LALEFELLLDLSDLGSEIIPNDFISFSPSAKVSSSMLAGSPSLVYYFFLGFSAA